MSDFPKIPGASQAVDEEHTYRIDAARSLMTAARELQAASERIADLAITLSAAEFNRGGFFPAAGLARDALRVYRDTNPLIRIDSALESAMLADRERGNAEWRAAEGR